LTEKHQHKTEEMIEKKVKVSNLITGLEGPEGSRRLRLPDFRTFGT